MALRSRSHEDSRMDKAAFTEALLVVMEQKTHWAWSAFTTGVVQKELLHIHLEQEYATYVRDFPVLLGWAYVQCPIAAARRELAENLYEEETGGLVAGRPHPELFLEYPRGLGMDLARFESVSLLAGARAYRAFLDDATQRRGWDVAAAITTLFIEGTPFERGELDADAPKRPEPALADHPLVKHYGLPLEHLALTKAHRKVEGSHRQAAWRVVLDHVDETRRSTVVAAMHEALASWKRFRDDVAAACGVIRPA
jgi:pyrroloquinoline quinone (PQQ) biosynthesis protein C